MPTYQYRCTECGRELEVVQKFSDPTLTECPNCTGTLRKVFNAVGVVFKGSGFYRTDSRDAGKQAATADKGSTNGKDSGSGEKKSDKGETKTEKTEKSEKKSESKTESKPSGASSGAKAAASA